MNSREVDTGKRYWSATVASTVWTFQIRTFGKRGVKPLADIIALDYHKTANESQPSLIISLAFDYHKTANESYVKGKDPAI